MACRPRGTAGDHCQASQRQVPIDTGPLLERTQGQLDRRTRRELAHELCLSHSWARHRGDRGTASFLPFEHEVKPRAAVDLSVPSDGHATLLCRERPVLCGVCGELMKYHGHRLTCLRLQQDVRAVDLGVAAGCVRCELAPDQLCQRHPLPPTRAQKFVRRCHRANASIERHDEISDRSAPLPGAGNNSTDGRECVLDAMVEFGQQSSLLLFHPFALGYVDADADDSVWKSSAAKRKKTARLHPTQLASGTK